jgi:predicted DCC family thiol-disulfide oxidoreductase YuxK
LRAAAHLFLFVGAGWLVFARTGVPLPGLDAEKVLLAAIHGHYTGFGGLILMAEAARRSTAGERRVLAATGIGLGLGFGLVGVGIAFAHALEPVGAGVLALALGGFAAVRVPQLLRSRGLEAVLGGLSLAGLAFGLSLGVMHSAGHEALSRPDMIRQHGWALALGFVLCGAASHLARHWATGPGPLLIYDGNCGLCDHTVQWILAHDRLKRIRFAALQGATAAPILRAHDLMPADGADFDTLVLAGPGEGVRVRSQAAFAILVHMGGVWRPLGHLGALVPRVLADAGYRLVANNRHRLFPRPDACRIPKPGERARFLP